MTSNLRAEMHRKATSAFLQYGMMRLESAVVVAGTILLTMLLPTPFPWWPLWGWPLLGITAWGTVIYASMTDPETSAKVLVQLLEERLQLREIKDQALHERVEAMSVYVRAVEADLYRLRESPYLPALEEAADKVYTWVQQSAMLARYVDTYRRDHRLELRRQELPGAIESLVARLKYERDPDIIARLKTEMENLEKDWQSLKLLEAQIQYAEPQLAQTLTALARAASETHVIAAERGLGREHVEHLQQDIERHLGQLTDLVTQIDRLYTDALNQE